MTAIPNGITIQKMRSDWANAATKLEVNAWNFTVRATQAAQEVFDKSFELGGFNTTPFVPWAPHSPRRRNPVMFETGLLRKSIKRNVEQRGFSFTGIVFSDPSDFASAKRHPGFYYAKVHNAPDGTYTYGNSGIPSIQRKFIGNSTVLDKKLHQLAQTTFFEGLP